ncbi:MAG: tetratricopeptide repeat protein [Gammaproteobacteria bacterium]
MPDDVRLALAKHFYDQELYQDAQRILNGLKENLPLDLLEEKKFLQAQLLLDAKRYEDILSRYTLSDDNTQPWSYYARYNLAMTLIESGQKHKGLNILHELSQTNPISDETAALKDNANITLGFIYLEDENATLARNYFQKVNLSGPLANQALLGTGWAHALGGQYTRAIKPWTELQKRNIYDPSVQEALIALPYALSRMSSFKQAIEHYQNAIDVYKSELSEINQSLEKINKGYWISKVIDNEKMRKRNVRDTILTTSLVDPYLSPLVEHHPFQMKLKEYKAMDSLLQLLEQLSDNVNAYSAVMSNRLRTLSDYNSGRSSLRNTTTLLLRNTIKAYSTEIGQFRAANQRINLLKSNQLKELALLKLASESTTNRFSFQEMLANNDALAIYSNMIFWQIITEYDAEVRNSRNSLLTGNISSQGNLQRQTDLFNQDLQALASNIQNYKRSIINQKLKKQALLEKVAIQLLEDQRARISGYLDQAYISVARLYDDAYMSAHK